MKTVISDLDGTLANIAHRRHLVEGKKKDWDRFFLESMHDTPNPPIIELCNVLYDADYKIRIFSGRREKARTETKDRLAKYGVQYHVLTMQVEGNYTPDQKLKQSGWRRFYRKTSSAYSMTETRSLRCGEKQV